MFQLHDRKFKSTIIVLGESLLQNINGYLDFGSLF